MLLLILPHVINRLWDPAILKNIHGNHLSAIFYDKVKNDVIICKKPLNELF
jgi:hypothetical protein